MGAHLRPACWCGAQIAIDCVNQGISIDLFLPAKNYVDVATVGACASCARPPRWVRARVLELTAAPAPLKKKSATRLGPDLVRARVPGTLSTLTGGSSYYYGRFAPLRDSTGLRLDIAAAIRRPYVYDAIMRVRTSTGLRIVDHIGHFPSKNGSDLDLAGIDDTKGSAAIVDACSVCGRQRGSDRVPGQPSARAVRGRV